MKKLFLLFFLTILISFKTHASIKGYELPAIIISYDKDTVTLEIGDNRFKFLRSKLGAIGEKLETGKILTFSVNNKADLLKLTK